MSRQRRSLALVMALSRRPDVLVLDVGLENPSAFELARIATAANRETQILFLAKTLSDALIEQAARCRMSGYMTKCEHVDTLIDAILAFQESDGWRL